MSGEEKEGGGRGNHGEEERKEEGLSSLSGSSSSSFPSRAAAGPEGEEGKGQKGKGKKTGVPAHPISYSQKPSDVYRLGGGREKTPSRKKKKGRRRWVSFSYTQSSRSVFRREKKEGIKGKGKRAGKNPSPALHPISPPNVWVSALKDEGEERKELKWGGKRGKRGKKEGGVTGNFAPRLLAIVTQARAA